MTSSDRVPTVALLAVLVLLYVLVRGVLVASLGDVFFYGEELEKGAAAKALLDGLEWPWHRIAYHPYEGGGFVVSHILAIVFALVGESLLAHKLVALLFGALVLVAAVRLAAHHFGGHSGLFVGLLLVFAPASFQKLSLLSLGIHFEACVFLLLALDATLRVLASPRDGPVPARDVGCLGLALGFGFFFNYQLAIVGLWSTLWLLARRPRAFTGRSLACGLGAFALGLLPLLVMASRVGGEVFDIHGTPLATTRNNFDVLLAFVRSFLADGSVAARASAVFYPLALAGGMLALLAAGGARRQRTLELASFLGLWFVVYMTSGFVVGEVQHHFQLMRFAPVWCVAAVLTGAGCSAAWQAPGEVARGAGRVLLGLALAWGLAATFVAAGEGTRDWGRNASRLARTKGYDYAGYFAKVFPRLEDPEQRALALVGFDEPHPALLRADFAQAVSEHSKETPAAVVKALALDWERATGTPVDENDVLPDLVRGLGAFASRRAGRDIEAALALAGDLPESLRPAWGEAVGRFGNAYAEFPGRIEGQLAALGQGPHRDDFLVGTGYRIWRRFVVGPFGAARFQLKPAAVERWTQTLPASDLPELEEGVRRAERLHTLP